MSVTILKCSQRRFKIQNDLRDWEVDNKNKPVKVINEKFWVMQEVSVDPKDIPAQKIELSKDEKLEDRLKKDLTKKVK